MKPIASGRDSDVYAHGEGLVLRRYRDGRSADAEAETLRELTRLRYPVPRVQSNAGPDIVMARVEGPTLAGAMSRGALDAREAGGLLADLHDRLHRLTQDGDEALLHLDLHPLNVLLSTSGPVVIDWSNARRGRPGLDVAMTALVLAQTLLTPGQIAADPQEDAAARAALPDLLNAYASATATDFVEHLDPAASLRRADPHQTSVELGLIEDAVALARASRET